MEGSTKPRGRRYRPRTSHHWRPALLVVASLLGCGGIVGSSPTQPPPPGITVTVAPDVASIPLGGTRTFVATVRNAANIAVTWSVNEIPGGNAAVGTIDATGVYNAPQILISPPSVSLTAISVADPSKLGTAAITVTSSFSLAVTGPSSVTAGHNSAYVATLAIPADSNPSRVIFWSVAGNGCTGAACGTISSSGEYTAPALPPSPATVNIIATPQADPSKAISLTVSIFPAIAVSISPSAATLALGSAGTFHATVTGALDATVTWDINGVVGGNQAVGTILNSQIAPNDTIYTAPQTLPPGESVTVHARSNADPSVSASAAITFTAAISVTLSPASATLAVSHRKTLTAAVNNAPNQTVMWQIDGIPGGNAMTGQTCATGSDPCQALEISDGGSVDYIAPAGLPSPNPVAITATSQADSTQSASASITILPHVVVSVQPAAATIAGGGQVRFTAAVLGADNQLVIWTIAGVGCGNPGACGSIDSTGLYIAPESAPTPDAIDVLAISSEDTGQSATANITITGGPAIFSLAPASAYAGSAGGFNLLVSGGNFSLSDPGPGSMILVASDVRTTSCASRTQCITSLTAADLQSPGNLSVQLQDPDGSLSNTETFVVLAPGSGTGAIPLTPSAPTSSGDNIVVVELSTNGGSGALQNVSLNIAAIGPYSTATSSCVLGGNAVVIHRPAAGTGTAHLCVFSVSALDPTFTFTVSGRLPPDITVINREPLGLGILHLTLRVSSTAALGPRTLFVQNPESDKAAGTGVIEVR